MESEMTGADALEELRETMLENCTREYMEMCELRSANIIQQYQESEGGKVFLSFLALRIMAETEKDNW